MPADRKRALIWKQKTFLIFCLTVALLFLSSLLIFTFLYFNSSNTNRNNGWYFQRKKDSMFNKVALLTKAKHLNKDYVEKSEIEQSTLKNCHSLSQCFNFERCKSGFNIYVYPTVKDAFLSDMYSSFLQTIRTSKYFTEDASKACIFVPSIDTLDRDVLSANYIRNAHESLTQLKYWNNGENHIIFNMFSGTWPDYTNNLSLNIGNALIIKTSYNLEAVRQGFDISFPLLPKDFPLMRKPVDHVLLPIFKKYLLSFKGKRYLYGIGSDTRNSVYVINNGKDIVMLTTCNHNKDWEKYADERCHWDNADYEKYDYNDLLANSTFCLIPRGRRLASFRLLEAIENGCIPVILSNGCDLPFNDVIDWSKFSITLDEGSLLQLPSMLREMNPNKILSMRQQTFFVWNTYFSSISKIIQTTIQILHDRIFPHIKKAPLIWNILPGGLHVHTEYSSNFLDYPFYFHLYDAQPIDKFTAIITATEPVYKLSSPLFLLIKTINRCVSINQILIVWLPVEDIPDKNKWPKTQVTVRVIHPPHKNANSRYLTMPLITTDAVFMLADDVLVTADDLDFAFSVWRSNPSKIVGFKPGLHLKPDDTWSFTTAHQNKFSTVDIKAAVFHKYYNYYYSEYAPQGLRELVARNGTCETLAINFVISLINQASPIKAAHSSTFALSNKINNDSENTACLNELRKIFGFIPLVCSQVSMNPVLYKDPVSIARLKYKSLL